MTFRRTITRTVLLALLTPAALSPVAAASKGGKPDLAMRAVTAPRSASPGEPLDIALSVGRSGRTGAATIGVYLSHDRVRDHTDTRLPGSARVPAAAGPGTGVVPIHVQVQVPRSEALGTYFVIACVDDANRIRERNEHNNCSASARPLTLTATPVSSAQLLATAVAAHKLTPQQAVVYRVFAAFGDRRLPSAYAGNDAEPDDLVMRAATDAWPTLSAAQKQELRPFFTPPVVSGSWFSPHASAAGAKIDLAPLVQPSCVTGPLRKQDWYTLAKPDGHVRLWWLKSDDERIGPQMRPLIYEIENTIWPKLHELMGREPLSDAGERCFHGGDGRLDIYMTYLKDARALTIAYPPRCTATPTFIAFNVAYGPPKRWELAHELMHAFQYAFHYRADCDSYRNWDESTATWAGQYVYPRDDNEHAYSAWYPVEPLTDMAYDGWWFPFAMEQLHGADTIAAIYRQTERLPIAQAIDAGVPGGLAQAWPEFALKAWNDDAVAPSFKQWDNWPWPVYKDWNVPIPTETLDTTAAHQTADVPQNLAPLTRSYRHFSVGPDVTNILVYMPNVPGIHVDAIEKFHDGTSKVEDWTQVVGTHAGEDICSADPAKQLVDLVLVLSNTSPTTAGPANQSIRLLAAHTACDHYTAAISGHYSIHDSSHHLDETWQASGLVFERDPATPWDFDLASGSVTWSLSGTQGDCSLSAGPVSIPVAPGQSSGELSISAYILGQRAPTYLLVGSVLPQVSVVFTCPNGTSRGLWRPQPLLGIGPDYLTGPLPLGGVIQGTDTQHDTVNRTVVYNYRFVPDV